MSYKMAHELGSPQQIQSAAMAMSTLYRKQGKHEEAYPYLLEHKLMSDSLMNRENTRKLTQAGLQYEFEKKMQRREIEQMKKDHEHEIEIEEQKMISYSFAIGAGALIILSIVILKSLRDKKKANKRITQQKIEIEQKSNELAEALENITDSVKYAKRIQEALLQSEEHVSSHFPTHFILFKPKDIVSGDFYWSYEQDNEVYIAAADCTGHGVPGALMNMLGISFLNSINAEANNLSPAAILDKLRKKVVQELHQTGKDWSSRDGMDISLCKVNIETQHVEWAGANNPLWIVSENDIREIKADRQAINYNEKPQPFTNHNIQLKKGDQLYLFSDGYADQFGGPKGKKFKYTSLKKLILSLSGESIQRQKELLDKNFDDWKGSLDQIDDVCIIGIQL
ncbi:MAG: SpoIIE family protein phosphatase [Flavobacteriales bacterium]|nr:SpoIIE family protein phosphatase [Flavobacteriales bacterium]